MRLVASDLDGTLLRSDLSVSDRTRAALQSSVARGIQVVVVSARPPRWLRGELDKLGIPGTGICCNGAVVYDFERDVPVAHHPLEAALGERLVELSAAGVTKAFALANVCAELGIEAHEVVAFGDMPNDVPMLEWAGRGIAVANAHPDALAAADEVTAPNDEDGVAQVLERLL